MIVTDGVHMVSDIDEKELHEFAQRMGLKRCWYRARSFPHYDLTTEKKVQQALEAGAVQIPQRDLVRIIQVRREKMR